MRSTRAILTVNCMYANTTVGQAVGKFLRYIHNRDRIQRGEDGHGLAGLVRYVAHREHGEPQARLFTKARTVGDPERRALVAFVRRSVHGVPANVLERKWSRLPAAYRFVLSPEDARGLDLRRLTRETLRQLESDAGVLPPWIAAEHRNTGHPHVHIVLAARCEVAPDQFRGVIVTRQRLSRMKAAMSREMDRQRGDRQIGLPLQPGTSETGRKANRVRTGISSRPLESTSSRRQLERRDPLRWRRRRAREHRTRVLVWYPIQSALARLAAYYRREIEREEREAMRRWSLSGRDRSEEREREVYE